MKHGNEEQASMIREAIVSGNGLSQLDPILAALEDTGALDYTLEQAQLEANKAINALSIIPDSEYKQALTSLAYLAANRNT